MYQTQTALALEYDVEQQGNALVVRLRGAAGHYQTNVLQRCLQDIQARLLPLVIMDLSGLNLIASAALGALIALQRLLTARQSQLRFVSLSDTVQQVFTAMRLDRLFSISTSTKQASASESLSA